MITKKFLFCGNMKKHIILLLMLVVILTTESFQAQWVQNTGPSGAIRAFAIKGTALYAGTSGNFVYVSYDNGSTWYSANNGFGYSIIYSLAVNGSSIFAGTWGGGVYLSTNDGNSWATANSGMGSQSISSLVVKGTNIFAGAYGQGVFLSTNNGTNWNAVNNGLTNKNISPLAVKDTYIFAGTNGGIFRSTDDGNNWSPSNIGLTDSYINALTVNNNYIFAGTESSGVFRSNDNGSTWTAVNSGLTYDTILSLTASGANIFAGTNGAGIFLSTNNGDSWTSINSNLSDLTVTQLFVKSQYLFAGCENVWRRPLTDLGILPMEFSVTISSNPSNGGTTSGSGNYYYGNSATVTAAPNTGYTFSNWTENGTIVSTNLSYTFAVSSNRNLVANFIRITYTVTLSTNPTGGGTVTGNGTYDINSLVTVIANAKNIPGSKYQFINWTENGNELTKSNSYTFIITFNRNLVANFLDITSVESEGGIPTKFVLSQNYPNPFNPTTKIQFGLPKETTVRLSIFNTLGQEIAILVNQKLPSRTYSVNFDASELPNGIYFYKIQAGGYSQTKKMILMK